MNPEGQWCLLTGEMREPGDGGGGSCRLCRGRTHQCIRGGCPW